MTMIAPINNLHAAAQPAATSSDHDPGRSPLSDAQILDATAETLWGETEDWRRTVEDIVDTVLLRISAIELSKVRSTWN